MILQKWEVICKNYPTEIQLSSSRRAKYWKLGDKLPIKYRDDSIFKWGKDGFLLDKGNNKIIKNPKVAFQPRFMSLNSQALYSGNIHHSVRAKVVNFLHNYFAVEMRKQLPFKIELKENEKFVLFLKHYLDFEGRLNSDGDNFNYFYQKCIQDCLGKALQKQDFKGLKSHKLGIIEDDSLKYMIAGGFQFIDSKEKMLKIILLKVDKDFNIEQ